MSPNMNEILTELKKAHALASEFTGGYSERFFGAEEFAAALGKAIVELENGNLTVIDDLHLWFLPTSDWDDFVSVEGIGLGQHISDLLTAYRKNT
jgi:hypothetical protein